MERSHVSFIREEVVHERPSRPQPRTIYPYGFISGSSRPASQGVNRPRIALALYSLNFRVFMGSETISSLYYGGRRIDQSCPNFSGLGVCYGRNGDNLPCPNDVINLYKKCGIQFIRIYDPDHQVLQALQGSNLRISLGVRNEDLKAIASSQTAANAWVNANIVPYKDVSFSWITLGNEVIPGPYAAYVPQAMKNIQTSISRIGLTNTKVTTVVAMNVLQASYPPSSGAFKSELAGVISQVAAFLLSTNAPLMLNVYPYFAYVSDPAHVSLEYATFRTNVPVVDGNLKYYNLFYAMVDAVNAALEKINAGNVAIVVSETGWPSAGNDPYTSIDNAKANEPDVDEKLTGIMYS
ncbi:hypothetical protein LguiA_004555 [Lonicera macranthoides]